MLITLRLAIKRMRLYSDHQTDADTGGMQGMHPPTRSKKVLT